MDRRTLAIVLGIGALSLFFTAGVLTVWAINPFAEAETADGRSATETPAVAEAATTPTSPATDPPADESLDEASATQIPPSPNEASATQVPTPLPSPTPTAPAEGEDTSQEPPPSASSSGDGLACMAFTGTITGLPPMMCLDDEGVWTTYATGNSPLSDLSISSLQTCSDGTFIVDGYELGIFDGQEWQQIETPTDGPNIFQALACTATDAIWAVHLGGVMYFDGTQWTTYDEIDIAPDLSSPQFQDTIAITPDGHVWVISAYHVHRFDGQTWTQYGDGAGWIGRFSLRDIAFDQTGQLWVLYNNGLLRFDGDTWQVYESPENVTFSQLAIDSQDRKWIASNGGIFRFDGTEWDTLTRGNSDLSSNSVETIAIDSAERVWVGTNWGLNIFDGTQWTSYHMDTSELPSNVIEFLAVSGDGPTLPAPIEKPTGSITGILRMEGNPLADAPVEICIELFSFGFSGATPCADQPVFYQTTTNADGQFRFEDVRTGHYVIAIGTGANWTYLTDGLLGSARLLVEPEQETNVGELVVAVE